MSLRSVLVAVGLTALLLGCSDDAPSASAGDEPYAVLGDDAWEPQEAIDPRSDDPIATLERPPMDWYAEYVQSSHTEMVRLSGHKSSFADAQAELEAAGFSFEEVDTEFGGSAVAGSADADPSAPSMLLLAADPGTLILLSYDVGIEELATIAGSLERVDQATWVASGGVVH